MTVLTYRNKTQHCFQQPFLVRYVPNLFTFYKLTLMASGSLNEWEVHQKKSWWCSVAAIRIPQTVLEHQLPTTNNLVCVFINGLYIFKTGASFLSLLKKMWNKRLQHDCFIPIVCCLSPDVCSNYWKLSISWEQFTEKNHNCLSEIIVQVCITPRLELVRNEHCWPSDLFLCLFSVTL